jgi:hypothetical protein
MKFYNFFSLSLFRSKLFKQNLSSASSFSNKFSAINKKKGLFFKSKLIYLLTMILVLVNSLFSVKAANSVGDSANGLTLSSSVTIPLAGTTAVNVANAAPVTLPSSGGNVTNSVASVSAGVPQISILTTGVINTSTSGNLISGAHAESSATVNNVNILNGFITAGTLISQAASNGNGTTATSTATGSQINNLRINGILQDTSNVAPNTVINVSGNVLVGVVSVPVSGTITLNAQTTGGDGAHTSSLTVKQLVVSVSGSALGVSLSVNTSIAIASSSVNYVVTAVKELDCKVARYDDGQIILNWKTAYETDNLGFNIYREEDGKKHLINSQLVAGSALTAGSNLESGQTYKWQDNNTNQETAYWIEDIDLNGTSTWHGPFVPEHNGKKSPAYTQSIALSGLGAERDQETLEMKHAQSGQQSDGTKIVEPTTSSAHNFAQQAVVQASLASQNTLKISIKREGWYRITQRELVAAGWNVKTDAKFLQMVVNGEEIPILVLTNKQGIFDESSAIEFYGTGIDTPFTDAHIYWLLAGPQPGKRIQSWKGEGVSSFSQSFSQTVERRDKSIYFSALCNGEQENFFGAVIARNPVEQSITLTHLDTTSSQATEIEIVLQGVTMTAHRVLVQINDFIIGEIVFNGKKEGLGKFSVQNSLLKEGQNMIRLIAQNGQSDISLVNHIRFSYPHLFKADNNFLKLRVEAKQQVTISGFTSKNIRVFDVTNTSAVQELSGEILQQTDGYSISVAAEGFGERSLLALTTEQVKQVAAIKANLPSNWQSRTQAADFIIIANRNFFEGIEPLRKVRQSEGYKVAVVDIEDVYDEFNFGNQSPQSLKDFLAFAKSNWRVKPRFVMFVGDSSFDPKNYLGKGNYDFVPTKLIDTNSQETASDEWFGDFNNDGISELAIGRLPVRTNAETTTIISKNLGYQKTGSANSALLVSDQNDGFNFEQASSQLRNLMPKNYQIEELKRASFDAATAKARLFDAIQQGQKLVNYIGHGSVNLWRGNLLTSEEARNLTNEQNLPVFVIMSCLNGYFQDVALDCVGESLLKAEHGGAVAVIASTGMTDAESQYILNEQLYRQMFTNNLTLGEALCRAKTFVNDKDVRKTCLLFGDPTLKLQ